MLSWLHLNTYEFISYQRYTKTYSKVCSETTKCSTFSHSLFFMNCSFKFPQQWSNNLNNVKWSTLNSGSESIKSFISLFSDNNVLVTVARKYKLNLNSYLSDLTIKICLIYNAVFYVSFKNGTYFVWHFQSYQCSICNVAK